MLMVASKILQVLVLHVFQFLTTRDTFVSTFPLAFTSNEVLASFGFRNQPEVYIGDGQVFLGKLVNKVSSPWPCSVNNEVDFLSTGIAELTNQSFFVPFLNR